MNQNDRVAEVNPKEAETALAELLKSLRIEPSAREPPMRQQRRWPRMVALVLALGAGGALAALPDSLNIFSMGEDNTWIDIVRAGHRDVTAPPAQAPAVAAEPARSRALVASGYVIARRKATVGSEIPGKVVEVPIEEGMVVKQGDVLARLDSVLDERERELAQSRADAAEAAIAVTVADLREAERIYARRQSLISQHVVSEADLTRAEAQVGGLRAQLKRAEVQFETAKLEVKRAADMLEKRNIRAPFNGVVAERSAQPGEMISPLAVGGFTRTGICTLIDMDSIEVEVDVNEAFIGRVQPGMGVEAVLDAYPDWTIPALVIAVAPTANREKATVKVRIRLKVKDPRILPEMAVKVTFEPNRTASDAANRKSGAN